MPRFSTTGIGSVPFESIDEAVRFSFEFDVPFLPETTAGGDMLRRAANVMSGIWPKETDAFLKKAAEKRPETLKVQIAGPVTLGKFQSQKGKLIEVAPYCESLVRFFSHLRQKAPAEWVLFMDEPSIATDAEGEWQLLTSVVKKLRSFGIPLGVHCCNRFPLSRMLALEPAYLSVDVAVMAPQLVEGSRAIERYQALGGQVVWGILQTHVSAKDFDWRLPSSALESDKPIWISPACGLAGWTTERVRKVPTELSRLAQILTI